MHETSKPRSLTGHDEDHSTVDSAAAQRGRPRRAVPMRAEEHHVDGRKINPNLMITLCSFCHRLVHQRAREAGADLRMAPPTLLHCLATVQRMRGSDLIELGQAMCQDANDIDDLISGLDEDFPKWRRLPEAK